MSAITMTLHSVPQIVLQVKGLFLLLLFSCTSLFKNTY